MFQCLVSTVVVFLSKFETFGFVILFENAFVFFFCLPDSPNMFNYTYHLQVSITLLYDGYQNNLFFFTIFTTRFYFLNSKEGFLHFIMVIEFVPHQTSHPLQTVNITSSRFLWAWEWSIILWAIFWLKYWNTIFKTLLQAIKWFCLFL